MWLRSAKLTDARRFRRLVALGIGTLFFLAGIGPATAGWDEGLAAYRSSDFAGALFNWVPLAEGGDPRAQEMLGFMFDVGEGVPEDDRIASAWYELAADQGLPDAQLNLGILLADGDGARRDDVEAYKWLELASSARDGELNRAALDALHTLSGRMSAAQIEEARRLEREWKRRHPTPRPL